MEDRPFGAERPLVAAVLRAVRAQGAGPPLQVHSLAWSRAWSRVRTAVLEESLPDVIEVGTTWLPALMALGVLMPAPSEPARRARWPQPTADERRYTVPWTWDIRFLYFSRSELGRVGMAPADLATMDGLAEAARRVRDAGRREPVAICGRPEPALVHNAAPWIWAEGGDLSVTAEGSGLRPGSPGFRGLENLLAWAREGLLAPSALELGGVDVFDRFASGQYAFVLAPAFGTAWGSFGGPDISVVPVPAGRSAQTTFSGGSFLAVTRGSLDPDRAWEALGHLSDATRTALAAHHSTNRRLMRQACREVGLALTVPGFFSERLNTMPHTPTWAVVESRLADVFSDWLVRASRQQPTDLAAEASALNAALMRQVAL
jgi:multiple sugar transport system substrate-binding protein